MATAVVVVGGAIVNALAFSGLIIYLVNWGVLMNKGVGMTSLWKSFLKLSKSMNVKESKGLISSMKN